MSAHTSARAILPMQTAGTHHFIERTYRESGQFQWVRELFTNADQAGATRVEFGVEWQAVENLGVYRRMIADNGKGMTAAQLVEFFNTFGGGGKPIGGAHENFGVGSKTSLLPWNRYGMVVISWVDGDASMIWVMRDEATEEYGLKVEKCLGPMNEPSLDPVYDPYEDTDHGCDWALVKPDWIEDHGTVVVLLGNGPRDDTVEGDPNREEKDIKGISSYLNRRFWEIPEGKEVYVDELRSNDRTNWPTSEAIAHGPPEPARDRRTNHRQILGARFHIEYPMGRFTKGRLAHEGKVELKDGTEVDWYLWEGERPGVHSYAASSGYIAAFYSNELYDITTHHATFRSFGVSDSSVRQRLWLIIRPPVVDPEGKHGVYPKTDRNSLLLKGGPSAGGPLPIGDWASEFADEMPPEIIEALADARIDSATSLDVDEWRTKLAEKFGARWRLSWLRTRPGGDLKTEPDTEGSAPIRRSKRPSFAASSGDSGDATIRAQHPDRPAGGGAAIFGKASTGQDAVLTHTTGTVPPFEPVRSGELGEGMLAGWQPKHPKHPEGAVLINTEHPVLRSVIEYWQSQYADHHAAGIERDVISVYGQIAATKIAHSGHLTGILPQLTIEKELRSDGALTMSLLGLVAEDHLIATKVGGKYSKKRRPVAELKTRPR